MVATTIRLAALVIPALLAAVPAGALAGEQQEILVLAPRRFSGALASWTVHRRAQGYAVHVAPLEDILTGTGDPADEARGFVRSRWKTSQGRLAFLLVVSDAGPVSGEAEAGPYLPPKLLEPRFRSTTYPCPKILASDAWLAMMDDDDVPDLAVGRWPADTVEEVKALVAKTLAYERSVDFTAWRKRVNLVAGPGGFGKAADTVIETLFKRFLLELLDPAYEVKLTYANPASPYCFPPPRFRDKVLDLMNEGSLVLAYVGHGSPMSFDSLRIQGRRYTVFDKGCVPAVAVRRGAPLVVIIACSTGWFDHRRADCVSEALLKKAAGPVAVFSSTRISHPYANGLVAKELIHHLMGGRHATVGEALLQVKKELVAHPDTPMTGLIDGFARLFMKPADFDPNRRDHVHLYTLFGDPALRLARPRVPARVTAGGPVRPGGELAVRCRLGRPLEGRAVVTLEAERGFLLQPVRPVEGLGGDELWSAMEENWRRANDTVAARRVQKVSGSAFLAVLEAPPSLAPGRYVVKVYVTGSDGAAMGAARVTVTAAEEPEDEEF